MDDQSRIYLRRAVNEGTFRAWLHIMHSRFKYVGRHYDDLKQFVLWAQEQVMWRAGKSESPARFKDPVEAKSYAMRTAHNAIIDEEKLLRPFDRRRKPPGASN